MDYAVDHVLIVGEDEIQGILHLALPDPSGAIHHLDQEIVVETGYELGFV